ncbi:MAG: DUF484 family protein [Pseudomonadota bacterium]|nr:DUF484 family protein [Pseudomonadota bacterium]
MSSPQSPSDVNKTETSSPNASDESVVKHLLAHPDFLDKHPEVLAEINLSHDCGNAISLIERQIGALRGQHHNSKQQLETLVQIARDNDRLNERMHRLTLAVLDAVTLNDIYIALDETLRGDFQADAVTIKLFINPDAAAVEPDNELMQTIFVPMNDPRLTEFKNLLGHEKPSCGQLKPDQLKYMFGATAESIKSTAVIPLGGESCSNIECPFLGLLAIGSRDANRFQSSMGTLFLSNLGDIISRSIKSHLPLRPDA